QQANGKCQQNAKHEGSEGKFERRGYAFQNQIERGRALPERDSKIAGGRIGQEFQVLHYQWLIEPERSAKARNVIVRRLNRQKQRCRVAGEAHQEERHGDDTEHREDRLQRPPKYEVGHSRSGTRACGLSKLSKRRRLATASTIQTIARRRLSCQQFTWRPLCA